MKVRLAPIPYTGRSERLVIRMDKDDLQRVREVAYPVPVAVYVRQAIAQALASGAGSSEQSEALAA